MTGDGTVDTEDLIAVIIAWGTTDADVNGDGVTNVLDLVEVITQWGEC